MKKLFSLITIFSALLVLSCSNFNNTTSVKITLNAGNARSAARDIEPDNKEFGYYIVASINGDYNEAQSKFMAWDDDECTFIFESVPVGKKIYAELNAYRAEAKESSDETYPDSFYRSPIHDYTGRSETITVTTGENYLPLELNSFDARYEDGQEWREPIHLVGKTSDGIPVSLELQMTGKYVLRGCTDNFYCVCSEGAWRSDEPINNETFYKEGSRTIYLTEYVYGKENTQKYPAGYEEKYTTPVIVELPQENAVTIKSGGRENYSFTFTSKSGRTFTFGDDKGGDDPRPNEYRLNFDWDAMQGDYNCPLVDTLPAGEEVYFTVTPEGGYRIKSVTVQDNYGNTLSVGLAHDDDGYYRFTMPEQDVKVVIEFEVIPPPNDFVFVEGMEIDGSEYANNPASSIFINNRFVEIGGFYMCDHEVTQAEYEEYCSYYSGYSMVDTSDGDNYPAYYVSWYDAIVYCNLRSIAENRTPVYSIDGETNPESWEDIKSKEENGKTKYWSPAKDTTTETDSWKNIHCDFGAFGYRLPTEAEWEYAARGGSDNKPYQFSGSNIMSDVTNGAESGPHEVKLKSPNSRGIYNMSGNIREWCWDRYLSADNYTSNISVSGPDNGLSRVLKGGSYSSSSGGDFAVFSRVPEYPYNHGQQNGFRVVLNAN